MLDALNDDCVRLVLSYVPVRDIARAERVSRTWQKVVLRYLRGIRIQIQPAIHHNEHTRINCRVLYVPEIYHDDHSPANLFRKILPKLGESVVASYCISEETLLAVTRHCPNLIHLAFLGIGEVYHWLNDEIIDAINIKQLKQISFRYMLHDVTDEIIRRFICSEVLEELVIYSNDLTGSCLPDLKSPNMKSLGIMYCKRFQHQYLLSVLDRLTDLTKLDLRCDKKTFENVHLVLDRMPKLEELTLHVNEKVEVNGNVVECLGRLSCLRLLDLASNPNVSDEWLHAVARGCKQLESLNLDKCQALTARSVVAVCRTVGPNLKWLSITGVSAIEYENVLEFIESCPKLQVRWTSLAAGREGRVVRARADCWIASRNQPKTQYPGLTVEFHSGDEDSNDDEDIDSDESDDSDNSDDGFARE